MAKGHQGRVAVIAGATGGLGYHFAQPLAQEGCKLSLADLQIPERTLAVELDSKGITVNAISPGLTRTESSPKHLPASLFEAINERQSIKCTEEPAGLCGAQAFITSEDAGFISGQVLNVDGGATF